MTAGRRRRILWPGRSLEDVVENKGVTVYLTREARATLARLNPTRRRALNDGFARVGRQLFASAEQAAVPPGWARGTSPRRRYPQQCYPKTVKYVLEHAEIEGMRLIHGIVSHAPHFVPLDHAWVELPGEIVFDGVVQTFFTRHTYYVVMSAVALDTYSCAETRRMVAMQDGPGPWNANWVPTAAQLDAYAVAVGTAQEAWTAAPLSVNVGRNR